jgi:hypothetical protein
MSQARGSSGCRGQTYGVVGNTSQRGRTRTSRGRPGEHEQVLIDDSVHLTPWPDDGRRQCAGIIPGVRGDQLHVGGVERLEAAPRRDEDVRAGRRCRCNRCAAEGRLRQDARANLADDTLPADDNQTAVLVTRGRSRHESGDSNRGRLEKIQLGSRKISTKSTDHGGAVRLLNRRGYKPGTRVRRSHDLRKSVR